MSEPIKFQVGSNRYEIEFEPCNVTLTKHYKYTGPTYEGKGKERIKTGEAEKEGVKKSYHASVHQALVHVLKYEEQDTENLEEVVNKWEFVLSELQKINLN